MSVNARERTKRHQWSIGAAVVIILILVGSVVVFPSQWHELLSFTGSGGTATTTTGQAPGVAQHLLIGAGFLNLNKLGNPNISVAVAYTTYPGSSLQGQASIDSGTTSASGLSVPANQPSLSIGQPYVTVYGDNTHYLLGYSVATVGTGATTGDGALLTNYTAPTVTFGNGTTSYPTTSSTSFHVVVASSGLTQPIMEIKGGSQAGGLPGSQGELLVFSGNTVAINFQTLSSGCTGATAAPASALPQIPYTGASGGQVGFYITAPVHNQVIICNPQISTTSSYAANTPIAVYAYAVTNYNLNGNWYPGVVVNPSTSAGTAIIAGVGSTTAFNANVV
jgi:hypothetical protein